MPVQKRHKTKYPSVYYIAGSARGSTKKERIYYIVYRNVVDFEGVKKKG